MVNMCGFALLFLGLWILTVDGLYLQGYMADGHSNTLVEYTFFATKVTWNDARQTCLSFGADLAVMTSSYVIHFMTQAIDDDYDSHIPGSYWVGLYEITHGQPKWTIGCNSDNLDDYILTWQPDEHCFYRSPYHGDTGKRDRCDNKHYFVCQRPTEKSCLMGQSYTGHYWESRTFSTTDECSNHCYNCDECTDAYYYTNFYHSQCHIWSTFRSGTATTPVSIISKYCIKAILNDTVVEAKYGGILPVSGCESDIELQLIEESSTPVSTISPTSTINYKPSSSLLDWGYTTVTVKASSGSSDSSNTSEPSASLSSHSGSFTPTLTSILTSTIGCSDLSTKETAAIDGTTVQTINPSRSTTIASNSESSFSHYSSNSLDSSFYKPSYISTSKATRELSSSTFQSVFPIVTGSGVSEDKCAKTHIVIHTSIVTKHVTLAVTSSYDGFVPDASMSSDSLSDSSMSNISLISSVTSEYGPHNPSSAESNFQNMLRNLTVDIASTSAYTRKLRCADDTRRSSIVMGWVGVMSVLVPVVIIVLSDIRPTDFWQRSYG